MVCSFILILKGKNKEIMFLLLHFPLLHFMKMIITYMQELLCGNWKHCVHVFKHQQNCNTDLPTIRPQPPKTQRIIYFLV